MQDQTRSRRAVAVKIIGTEKGFTLLEIIAILVILGILAVVVVSRTTSMNAEVYTGADTLKTHLRYAQTVAMNKDPNVVGGFTVAGISYDAGANQYWLFSGVNPSANIMLLPDDARFTDASRKINLNDKKIRFDRGFTIYFNNRGIPYVSYPLALLMTDFTVTVSGLSGGATRVVQITPETGFIP
jgi:MSHA pilin protein MshC